MKHLPKHLRPRWRYLAVGLETWPDADFDARALQRHCWYAAQNLLGDPGSAALDLSLVRSELWDGGGEVIVRVRRGEVERARAVLACVDEVEGHPVGVHVRGVSGTVRACEEKYMGRGPEAPDQRYVAFAGTERPAFVWSDRYDVRLDDGFAGATGLDFE